MLCDWGTSRLRAYLLLGDEVVARCEGPGIGALKTSAIAILQDTLQPWRIGAGFERIVACGMIGSRNGIVEVPYVQAPTGLAGWAEHAKQVEDCALLIAAGVSGVNPAGVPDVMRGEETQIFGALACDSSLATGRQKILLPGTHSKWVDVIEGRIMTVQTYVTGELFAVLRDHSSLLRAGDSGEPAGDGFAAGLARSRHSGLADSLFETRAAQLTQGRSHAWAVEFLSGLLIGNEVAAAHRTGSLTSVVIVGDNALSQRYQAAFRILGISATYLDGDRCAVSGLQLLAARYGRAH